MSDENLATNITPSSFPQSSTPIKTYSYIIHYLNSFLTVLVTPILIGDNYGLWSRVATMSFRVKRKLDFVDGSLPIQKEKDDISNGKQCKI